jgi:hypothetical protein
MATACLLWDTNQIFTRILYNIDLFQYDEAWIRIQATGQLLRETS